MVLIKNLSDFFQYSQLCPICQEPMECNIYNLNRAYCRLMTDKLLVRFKENFLYPTEIEFDIDLISNSIRILNGAKTKFAHYYPIEIERVCSTRHLGLHISAHLDFSNNSLSVMRNSIEEKFIYLTDGYTIYIVVESQFTDKVSITINKLRKPGLVDIFDEEKIITLNRFDIYNIIRGNEVKVLDDLKKMLSLI